MSHSHLTDERIQEWLDGRLSERERAQVEAHLGACEHCRAEADMWSSLMADLSSLPDLDPGHELRGRVLSAVSAGRTPAALPWAARIVDLFRNPAHPDAAQLEALLTGALPRRQTIRLREHVDACDSCRHEALAWSAVLGRLDALPRMAPSEGFGDAVMARLRVAQSASAMAPARVRMGERLARRAVARARALVGPGRRRAWAAVAGVALTPATVVGLVAYTIFSHPLVTLGNLGSFVWLKGGAAADALGGGFASGLTQNAVLFRAWSLVGTMARTPVMAGTGLIAFTVLTAMAVWVLYRNLFSSSARPAYARARN